MRPIHSTLAWLSIGACLAGAGCGKTLRDGTEPDLYLWAWQRTEDLSFIDPAKTKLALWIATLTLDERGLDVDARRNPVRYPSGTEIVAVVRIEATPYFDDSIHERIADEIAGLVEPLGAPEVQIDFDATASQRDFYGRLLGDLRARLPGRRLSITALASWCFGDRWIGGLPIDSAVPMYYRMGLDGNRIRHDLSSRRQIPASICRDNAGYSLDEPDMPPVRAGRVFVFNPEPWNEKRLSETRRKLDAASAD